MLVNGSHFESEYLRTKKRFLDECNKRDIRVANGYLEECEALKIFTPAIYLKQEVENEDTGETEYVDDPYYDLFQIPTFSILVSKAPKISDLTENKKHLREKINIFQKGLPLLYQIRYFYHRDMYSIGTSGILPPFPLTREQDKNYLKLFSEIYNQAKSKYKPRDFLKSSKISIKDILSIRERLFLHASLSDPMINWYPFIREVRRLDYDKFKQIKKGVLLAHDFYIQAEILSFFYKDLTRKPLLDLEDIFDGTAGNWKFKHCEQCKLKMRVKNLREKYCKACKVKIAQGPGVTVHCSNKECKKPIFKYADGNELLTKLMVGGKSNTTLSVKCSYGRTSIVVSCDCGAVTPIRLESGWF